MKILSKKWVPWLLCIASTILTLAVLEVVFRFCYDGKPDHFVKSEGKIQKYYGPKGYNEHSVLSYAPNFTFDQCFTGSHVRPYFGDSCMTYHINNQGFRGENFDIKRDPQFYRMVFVGDSFTFGIGVKDNDVYPFIVSQLMAGEFPRKKIEVINLGIPGHETNDEIDQLNNFIKKLEPDLVLVQWNTNDFLDKEASFIIDVLEKKYRSRIHERSQKIFGSQLASYFYQKIAESLLPELRVDATLFSLNSLDFNNLSKVIKLKEICQKFGSKFALIIFPELLPGHEYPYAPILKLLKETLTKYGIQHLDLLPFLQRNGPLEKLWVHGSDPHPNEVAHAIVGKETFTFLKNLVLSDRSTSATNQSG